MYTSTSCPGWNTGYGLSGIIFCLFVGMLGKVSTCELKSNLQIVPRVLCDFFGDCCSYKMNTENDIDCSRGCLPNSKKNGVSCVVALKR